MPLARILAASTSRPVVAAARGRNSNPTYAAVNKKKTSPASKKTMLKRKTASVVNIPRTNESNVVSVRRSYDEDMDRADFTFPSFYTMAGGHPENALSLSPNRKDITETTLQALGLELGLGLDRGVCALSPVWPTVSVFAADGPRRDLFDPTTRERLASIRSAKWAHVDAALSRARDQQRRWAKLDARTRVGIILEINDEIKMRSEHLVNLLTLEVGKVPSEAAGEVVEIHEVAEAIAERVAECGGSAAYPTRSYPSRDTKRAALGWRGEERALPLGIVGKVTAFNFPYAPFGWGALPALAAGNAVVWKPHPAAILTGMSLARVFDDVLAHHGFSGLVSAFDGGTDNELCQAYAMMAKTWNDSRVGMWEATGGEDMGVALRHSHALDGGTAALGTRVLLELGGNNAAVVHGDAAVAQAVASALFGATGTAGQRCTTTRVPYVHEALYEEFERRLVEGYCGDVRVGDPLMRGVNVGPVFHKGAVARFEHGVAACLAAGSELLCGGHVLGGNFVEPTLFRALLGFHHPPTARELFSPVLHLVRYKEGQLQRVIDDINRTGYGLSAGVFTADLEVFEELATSVRVGIMNLNYGTSGAEAGENFGGEGRTGGGRQMGPGMFTTYTRYVNSMRAPHGGEVVHAQGVNTSSA